MHVVHSEEDLDSVRSLETSPLQEHADTYEPDENLRVARWAALYPALGIRDYSQIKTNLPTHWNEEDKSKYLLISSDGLRVIHRTMDNPNKQSHNSSNASSVRANNSIPTDCGIYYFEVVVKETSKGLLGIGLCQKGVTTSRLPGWDPSSYGYHGDDGNFFSSSGNGKQYGEKFGSDDTVGCGINFIENYIFFTKNGVFQGVAEKDIDLMQELFPVVGMQTALDRLDVNFGQQPFAFDIYTLMEKTKKFVVEKINEIELPTLAKHDWCHKIVAGYLQTEGYSNSLEAFKRYVSEPAEEPTDMIQARKRIMDLINAHRSGEALKMLEEYFPNMLSNPATGRRQVILLLKIQHFVECAYEFIMNEQPPRPSIQNGNSHSSLSNGNSANYPSTSAVSPRNLHKRGRSQHTENDAPSPRKVQSARKSVADRLSADQPCSSKNGTSTTNGNGVAFHDAESDNDHMKNGNSSVPDGPHGSEYSSHDKIRLANLVNIGRCLTGEAQNRRYVDDYLLGLIEEALSCVYNTKESMRKFPLLKKTHVSTITRKVNDSIMESFHLDTELRPMGRLTLPKIVKMWRARKETMLAKEYATTVFTNDREILYGSSDEEDDDETSTDDSEDDSEDSGSSYTDSSEEYSEEEVTDEETSSSEEEEMDAEQPTHSRAAIKAAH